MAKSDNLGATKTTTKTNIGPWQQSNNTGGYNDGDNNGSPSSPADGEDNNAAMGANQGKATTVDNDGGDADAGMLSVLLAATNAPDQDDNANNRGNDGPSSPPLTGRTTMPLWVTTGATQLPRATTVATRMPEHQVSSLRR